MKSLKKFRLIILLGFLFTAFCLDAAQLTISTEKLKGGKVGVGEKFQIIVKGVNVPEGLEFSKMPGGVDVIYKGFSTNGTYVNGHAETVKMMTLTCKALTPGKYTFGPVRIGNITSNTVSYEITADAQQGGMDAQGNGGQQGNSSVPQMPDINQNKGPVFIGKGNEEFFMKASISKTNAYEQEALIYTVKLYTTYETIKFIGATTAPKFEGFVVEESDDVSTSLSFENLNGKTYKTAVIAKYILYPQKPGKLKIIGNTYTVSTDARSYYHDWYFQNMVVRQPIQLNATPNDLTIDIRPLPTPVPADFIGGVGKFNVTSEMPQTQLSTNSAASLIYRVNGTGNIKYIKLPELSNYLPKQLEVYSPKVNVETKVGTTNVSGSVTFDYLLMPRETGTYQVPPMEFSYFDPDLGQYVKVKTQGYKVNVGLGKASDKSQKVAEFNPDLMPVGSLSKSVPVPYISSIWYWLWFVIPILLFVFSLASYRKYVKDHEDIQLLRSKQANKMAIRRLKKAFQCIKAKKDEQFYDEMLAALWGYLGDKLKMPTSELTRSNVGEEFKSHGIQESTFMPILNLIDECEYAKYTPVARSANMKQLYADAVKSLAEVESEFTKQNRQNSSKPENNEDIA